MRRNACKPLFAACLLPPGAIGNSCFFTIFEEVPYMALYVGIDVSKDTFHACGIGKDGEKVFSLTFLSP